jgi:uridine kinase
MEKDKVRPIIIGICGGPLTGKSDLAKKISESVFPYYKVCIIHMSDYYKILTEEESKNKENYNFDKPNAIDFDLLISNIEMLINNKPVQLPKYDMVKYQREYEKEERKECQVIILEGIFSFYLDKIMNLMDLKIFIDVDKDIQLSRIIYKDLFDKNRELHSIIEKYHRYIKPGYNEYILPKIKLADIILHKVDETSIYIVSEYIRMQLHKILKEKDVFSFINEIIDQKYNYYNGKIILETEKSFVDFIKQIFLDFLNSKLVLGFIPYIRNKMISKLSSLLMKYLENNGGEVTVKRVDTLILDSDNIDNFEYKSKKYIFFYKTSILSDDDIKIPKKILSENKTCTLVIFTIFLAPKYADLILSKEINSTVITTIYFSDFFIKYENIIKSNETMFKDLEFKKLVIEKFKKDFNYERNE